MFRISLIAVMMMFAVSTVYADDVGQSACKAACIASKDKCVKEAAGGRMKEMACNQAFQKCMKDCEKEEAKEKDRGKGKEKDKGKGKSEEKGRGKR
ncbi:MAG: hypothetical protein KBA15_09950 [Spirochaetes bacterium]|jgi:hypothetical protein|nr:hypothetical protein [Spirochaetota bacterium]